jgi:hypothetical protein
VATYQCNNFGADCPKAESREIFEFPAGTEDICPGCTVRLDQVDGPVPPPPEWTLRQKIIVAIAVFSVLAIVAGYFAWDYYHRDCVLRPPVIVKPPPPPPGQPPVAPQAPGKSAMVIGREEIAKRDCDEAVFSKKSNAPEVCNRAAAIVLMNAGALAANNDKLDQADLDYAAAKQKYPNLAELYVNLAILKARQKKDSEVMDNLLLAESKGYKEFALLKNESAFDRIRQDPQFKEKLLRLEKEGK